MLLGFISLLLTVGEGSITSICVSEKVGSTWHPCHDDQRQIAGEAPSEEDTSENNEHRRRLLMMSDSVRVFRRSLAGKSEDKCADKVYMHIHPLIFLL